MTEEYISTFSYDLLYTIVNGIQQLYSVKPLESRENAESSSVYTYTTVHWNDPGKW